MYSIFFFPTSINSVSVHTQNISLAELGVSVDILSWLLHPSKGWGQPAKPQAAGDPSGSMPPGAISDIPAPWRLLPVAKLGHRLWGWQGGKSWVGNLSTQLLQVWECSLWEGKTLWSSL